MVGSLGEGIRFGGGLSRAINDLDIEAREELLPSDVAGFNLSSSHEVLEVLVVGDNDRRCTTEVREVLFSSCSPINTIVQSVK